LRSKKRKYYGKGAGRRKNQRIWSRPIVCWLLLILLIALGHVWQRVTVLKLSQDAKSLKGELSEIEKRYKYLNIEIASLSSVERIQSIAVDALGLTYPQAEKIIYLNEPLISSPDKPEDLFALWAKLKRIPEKLIFVTEERLEAKEIKHDL
jgi:cell division protein FtsL